MPLMTSESVLILGDTLGSDKELTDTLAAPGRLIGRASGLADALPELKKRAGQVVLLDPEALEMTPWQAVEAIQQADPEASILLVVPWHMSLDGARGQRLRAAGCLVKPIEPARLLMAVETALFQRKLIQENRALKQKLRDLFDFSDWVGCTPQSEEVRKSIATAALGSGPVLLLGEDGSGRRLAAELIHSKGDGTDSVFLPVDLGSLPAGELSRLIGGLPGGGGIARLLPRASGSPVIGSLYLSELKALNPGDQRALASFLSRPAPFRLLASADPSLGERVRLGKFDRKLFERIAAFTIYLPPLRERRGDIPLLINHFLRRFSKELNLGELSLSLGSIEQLSRYHWPGNVTELAMVIESAVSVASAAKLESTTLPENFCIPPSFQLPEPGLPLGQSLKELIADTEKQIIIRTLKAVAGSQRKAAQLLRLKPTTLHEKMKRYRILPHRMRSPFNSSAANP